MDSRGIEQWFKSETGKHLLSMEKRLLAELLPSLFGYYLVQLEGLNCFADILSDSRVRHHFIMQSSQLGNVSLVGLGDVLPLATDSIDLIFMPHTLDFSDDYHQVLREVERVLIPEGKLILIGFNPWSTWGVSRFFKNTAPWNAHFVSAARVRDWLNLLGFSIDSCQFQAWMPPLHIKQLRPVFDAVDGWLAARKLAGGGIYTIEATRRVSRLTPLAPEWKRRAAILGRPAVEASLSHCKRDIKYDRKS